MHISHRYPKVKTILAPFKLASNIIRFGGTQVGVAADIEDEDGTIWKLISLMNGKTTLEAINETMLTAFPDLDADSICEAIQSFIDQGMVEEGDPQAIPEALNSQELNRYDRNFNYFTWIDTQPRQTRYDTQVLLKQARVLLLGVGGSGSAVATSLALSGIGHLHLVDMDIIELSNLNRQSLYTEADLGMSKVSVAVNRLRQLNPNITVIGTECQLDSMTCIRDLMAGYHVAILCADKPADRIQSWTNAASLASKTPFMISAYAGPMLVNGLFVPGETPCFECYRLTNEDMLKIHLGESDQLTPLFTEIQNFPNAVIAPSAALTGHLAALETIHWLTGLKVQLKGKVFHLNLLDYTHTYHFIPELKEHCPMCGRTGQFPNPCYDRT